MRNSNEYTINLFLMRSPYSGLLRRMIKAGHFYTTRHSRLRGSKVHRTFIGLSEIKNRTAVRSANVEHKLPSNTMHCPRMETSPASRRIPETIKLLLCSSGSKTNYWNMC